MTDINVTLLQIAYNVDPNAAALATNIRAARLAIEADNLLPEGERQITAATRLELSAAIKRRGGALLAQIGIDLPALAAGLPPAPAEDDSEGA